MVDEQTMTECAECARLKEMCRRTAEIKQQFIAHLERENKTLRQAIRDIERLAGNVRMAATEEPNP